MSTSRQEKRGLQGHSEANEQRTSVQRLSERERESSARIQKQKQSRLVSLVNLPFNVEIHVRCC